MTALWFIHTARKRDTNRYGEGDRNQDQDQWVLIYCTEMFTLIWDRDRDQDPLLSIVLVYFPVPGPLQCEYAIKRGTEHREQRVSTWVQKSANNIVVIKKWMDAYLSLYALTKMH